MSAGLHRLHYSYPTPPSVIPGGITTVQTYGPRRFAAAVAGIMASGGEVLEYTLPTSDYDFDSGEPETQLFYTGKTSGGYVRHSSPKEWFWDHANPDRVRVPAYRSRAMDMRKDSAWVNHLIENYYPAIAEQRSGRKSNGSMLDVSGDGYWGAYTGFTADEKDEHAEGQRDFWRRLRLLFGESLIIVCNNAMNGPVDDIDGIMIENHSPAEREYWENQASYVRRTIRRRNITLSASAADALAWSKVPGIDAVTTTAGDYQIGKLTPGIAITVLPGHVSPGSTTPPPPPPPVIEVPSFPTGLVVKELDGALRCAWDPKLGVKAYQLYIALSGSMELPVADGLTSSAYTIPNLINGQQYSIRVSASAALGSLYGPWSPAVLATPNAEVVTPPVEDCADIRAQLDDANIKLTAATTKLEAAHIKSVEFVTDLTTFRDSLLP